MKRYINYFKFVVKHKWFVIKACLIIGGDLHLFWRCLLHDLSKFKPSEFIPYANTFYNADGTKKYEETTAFNIAWNAHQKCNKHHWQYWLLKMDRGDIIALDMPAIYINEMICDWLGAGRAINGKYDFNFSWYKMNENNIQISENTRKAVNLLIDVYSFFEKENN